ncbi:MAG: hypothetical protein P1U88_08235 [Thalassobaculaceae bacterium]|nr:hypothetical protein [Thalassobaculaceae bacterium]
MLLRLRALLFAVAALGLLSACASGAKPEAMVAHTTNVSAPTNPTLQGAMQIGTVSGGSETNPMWTSQVDDASFRTALEDSLRIHGYLAPSPAEARYTVDAQLQQLDQPIFGFNFTVASSVDYAIQGPADRRSIPISASGRATFGDSPIAVERLRLANEKSIQENIRAFLVELSRF